LPNFYLKKTDLIGFFKIKPRHPDGLKKSRSGWKNPAMGPLAAGISRTAALVQSRSYSCAVRFHCWEKFVLSGWNNPSLWWMCV